jgi:hypothetical protein
MSPENRLSAVKGMAGLTACYFHTRASTSVISHGSSIRHAFIGGRSLFMTGKNNLYEK